jgi:hypothetical protein
MNTKRFSLAFLALALPLALSAQPTNPSPPEPPPQIQTYRYPATFTFPGGTPRELLTALQKPFAQVELKVDPSAIASQYHWTAGWPERLKATEKRCKDFKVDWLSVADIPPEMDLVRVPSLRIPFTLAVVDGDLPGGFPDDLSLSNIVDFENGSSVHVGKGDLPGLWAEHVLKEVVAIYERLSKVKSELGHLVVQGSMLRPEVVMLYPGTPAAKGQSFIKVKAFPLKGLPDKTWDALSEDIAKAREEARRLEGVQFGRGAAEFTGSLTLHRDTQLLLATGAPAFIELAESVVNAHKANQTVTNSPTFSSPPNK